MSEVSNKINNFCSKEVSLDSERDFGKRARNILSTKSIYSFSHDLLSKTDIDPNNIAKNPIFSPTPKWEQSTAMFDINYTDLSKEKLPNI